MLKRFEAGLSGLPAREVLRFCVIGAWNNGFDFALFGVLHFWLGQAIWIANPISYVVVLLLSFLLNRHWVFGGAPQEHRWHLQFGRFVVTNLIALVMATVAIEVLKSAIGVWPAKISANIGIAVLNYIVYRRLIFVSARSR